MNGYHCPTKCMTKYILKINQLTLERRVQNFKRKVDVGQVIGITLT